MEPDCLELKNALININQDFYEMLMGNGVLGQVEMVFGRYSTLVQTRGPGNVG